MLGQLLYLAYVNDIWRDSESTVSFFADDCIIYKEIINKDNIEKMKTCMDRLGEWAAENAMKINPSKCDAVRFMRTRVKDPLIYTLGGQLFPKASSCKYLGIILHGDLSWADHVNYTVKRPGRHYIS